MAYRVEVWLRDGWRQLALTYPSVGAAQSWVDDRHKFWARMGETWRYRIVEEA